MKRSQERSISQFHTYSFVLFRVYVGFVKALQGEHDSQCPCLWANHTKGVCHTLTHSSSGIRLRKLGKGASDRHELR
jgi:hypothetical protein